jgi:3-hydroxyisobutyrate dehydrogenase-like beta-hydroxyacid dehydrogenase
MTPADAFRGDAVISMLPNDQALREVFIEGDLLKYGRPSIVSVNMGTVSLDWVDALVAAHDAHNIPYVAATVFGGTSCAMETDCVAGHLGFEPANPSASYLIGFA